MPSGSGRQFAGAHFEDKRQFAGVEDFYYEICSLAHRIDRGRRVNSEAQVKRDIRIDHFALLDALAKSSVGCQNSFETRSA